MTKILESGVNTPETCDIVTMMLQSNGGLSIKEVFEINIAYQQNFVLQMVANVFFFFAAGHETTASALSWLVYHLAINPTIQQKVYEEVNKSDNIHYSPEAMRELKYTSFVIKESMRLQPPITEFSIREAAEEVEFEGVHIPKGVSSNFCISNYIIFPKGEDWTGC